MGDNQWSSGVETAGFCSFGALDHQCQVLHQSSLPYLSEDRDSTSYQVVSVIRLPVRYYHVPFRLIFVPHPKVQKNPKRICFPILQPSISLCTFIFRVCICSRTNLNYTGSSALILSRKAVSTQPHFKQCNPVVCWVKS
jgi:hypothetical protein